MNDEPKWVTIPSMTEYESRLYYKRRNSRKNLEESNSTGNDERKNDEAEPGSSTASKVISQCLTFFGNFLAGITLNR